MVEAPPSTAFVVVQSDLVLQFLVVALGAPPQLCRPHERCERRVRRQGRQEVLRGLLLARGPLDQKPFLGAGLGSPVVAKSGPDADRMEARRERGFRALPPGHGSETRAPDSLRERLDGDRLMGRVSREKPGGASLAGRGRGRQRALARRPDSRRSLDSDGVFEAERGDVVTEGRAVAVSGIGQENPFGDPILDRGSKLGRGDLELRPERDFVRDTRLHSPLPVGRPDLRQIELVGDGQAEALVGHGEAYGDLAVLLLSENTAVLTRDSHRMASLLRNARVVHDPRLHTAVRLEHGQGVIPDRRQKPAVAPGRIRHQVVHALMDRAHVARREPRGHRLHTLPLPGQKKPGAVEPKRLSAIRMPDRPHQDRRAVFEPFARRRGEAGACGHGRLNRTAASASSLITQQHEPPGRGGGRVRTSRRDS